MKPVARGYASDKTGLPPGSLVYVGQLLPFRDSGTVTWVIAEGLADVGYFPEHPTVLLLYFRRKKWL